MKTYRPFATFNEVADIMDLFPSADFKEDCADIVLDYYFKGGGRARTYDSMGDTDTYYTEDEIREDKCFIFGRKYPECAVRFIRGDVKKLRKGDDQHGYYIDLYTLNK